MKNNEPVNLNYIFGKALRGEQLTPAEIKFAEGFVSSENAEHAIMANSILFRTGDNEQSASAYGRLRRVCKEGSVNKSDLAVSVLLTILECFSRQQLESSTDVVDFIYQAAKHPFLGARINAMRVLRQLAIGRDQKAIQILKESVRDPHPYVAETAQTSLKLADIEV